MRKKKRPAVFLRNAAAELPAHQRMQFCIFVHRLVDTIQQPRRIEQRNVLAQIGISAGRRLGLVLQSSRGEERTAASKLEARRADPYASACSVPFIYSLTPANAARLRSIMAATVL